MLCDTLSEFKWSLQWLTISPGCLRQETWITLLRLFQGWLHCITRGNYVGHTHYINVYKQTREIHVYLYIIYLFLSFWMAINLPTTYSWKEFLDFKNCSPCLKEVQLPFRLTSAQRPSQGAKGWLSSFYKRLWLNCWAPVITPLKVELATLTRSHLIPPMTDKSSTRAEKSSC